MRFKMLQPSIVMVISLTLASIGWVAQPLAQELALELAGKVVDSSGKGLPGAKINLMESDLSTTADAQGNFLLKGTVAGIVKRISLPGGFQLSYAAGRISFKNPMGRAVRMELLSAMGQRRLIATGGYGMPTLGQTSIDLDKLAGSASGIFWLRVHSESGSSTFRFLKSAGSHGVLYGGSIGFENGRQVGLGKTQNPMLFEKIVLEVSATGYLVKRFNQAEPVKTGLSLVLLPTTATLKNRIQDFIGPGRNLRLAFLRKEVGTLRKFVLNYVNLAEMAKDTMPVHVFADSRGPETSSFGASAPSWSPDGKMLAYEIGFENLTLPISRIYLQPLTGPRQDGPANPATNPRWWSDGLNTFLTWCTSGNQAGWADTSSATLSQKFTSGGLNGMVETLAKGSYNGGLSPNGRYLATGFPYGVMLDKPSKTQRYMHVYPGHPKARDGSSTDSLQVCNASISTDSDHPSRMLFLDFGVTAEPTYANMVVPKIYAQHRMILFGDFTSEAPGGIVDFIDTPPSELALNKTWDDPEWTNLGDFVVATTRDPNGDLSNPAEPQSTQPDIYLIKISTKESLRIISGGNQTQPVAWIGP
jgi:hypothetical protein